LKFKGHITTEPQQLFHDDFILNSNAPVSSEYYKVINPISIGIFNLIKKPTLTVLFKMSEAEPGWPAATKVWYTLRDPYATENVNDLYYVFNQNNGITMTSLKAAFVYENKAPFRMVST